uniref:ELIP2 n=1 Tax=Syntrichia caninervis TaxID=200751 RepID=A0A0F7LA41_9BRYO|nr:ELIP2 [Syntrichia caninervis]
MAMTLGAMTATTTGAMSMSSVRARNVAVSSPMNIQGMRLGQMSRVSRTRCMAVEPEQSKSEVDATPVTPMATPATPAMATPLPATPSPSKSKKVSTNFFDVFSFAGPAPETINGRLAMLGFTTALGVELFTGEDLATQIGLGGVQWFIVVAAIFTGASLIPMFRGVTVDDKSKPVFSSTAEKWNGRFAMIGLVALAITEFVKGSPLV